MLIARTVNRFIARLLVGMMVFAQLTAGAYACAGAQDASMRGAGGSGTDVLLVGAAMTDPADGAPGHGAMDPAQPNVCAAHCQSAQQNADGKPAPSVPAAIPTSLYPRALAVSANLLRASTALVDPPPKADPPHAILHCCFRI